MKIEDSYNEFRKYLKASEKKVTGLTPSEGIPLFKSFFKNERATDAQDNQGDGLACYFGLSRDGGLKYEVGVVRLFRIAGLPPHEANRRLRLSFTYPFVETIIHGGLDKLPGWPEGNKFCWQPEQQTELDIFIEKSAHIQAVLHKVPKQTKLKFENLWGVF